MWKGKPMAIYFFQDRMKQTMQTLCKHFIVVFVLEPFKNGGAQTRNSEDLKVRLPSAVQKGVDIARSQPVHPRSFQPQSSQLLSWANIATLAMIANPQASGVEFKLCDVTTATTMDTPKKICNGVCPSMLCYSLQVQQAQLNSPPCNPWLPLTLELVLKLGILVQTGQDSHL